MAPARPARASVFDLWPLRETLTRSCDFPLKGSSGSRVTCGPRVSPLHVPSSDLELFETAEVGSGSIQEIPPKVLQEIQARNNGAPQNISIERTQNISIVRTGFI